MASQHQACQDRLSGKAGKHSRRSDVVTISHYYGPLYRRWASMRLKCFDGWVSTWALPQMFAGVAQQGAADATYQVLSEVEKMTLEGVSYCGGAADIYKFFDQILRSLVYAILRLAGVPTCILEAYRRFLEELITCNIVAGGLGHGQKRMSGLPQECPSP